MSSQRGQRPDWKRANPSAEDLRDILGSQPSTAAILRIRRELTRVFSETELLAPKHVREVREGLRKTDSEMRRLLAALTELENVLADVEPAIGTGSTVDGLFAMLRFQESFPLDALRQTLAMIREIGEATRRWTMPGKVGTRPDLQARAVAHGVGEALRGEGLLWTHGTSSITNPAGPWYRITALMLTALRGSPVKRVDRCILAVATEFEKAGLEVIPRRVVERRRQVAQSRTQDEYQKWRDLDQYLCEHEDFPTSERNRRIAERFAGRGVTAEEVRRARKRGVLKPRRSS